MENFSKLLSLFVWQSIFFITTLILGLVTAMEVRELVSIEQIQVPSLELWKFLLIFVVATIFMVFFVRLPRGKGFLFRAFFIISVWWGGSIVLSVWLEDILALGILTVAVLVWLFRTNVFLHNILVILGIAGIASVFGLRFSPEAIVVLLILFAIYDVIAVYKTKHMVRLARAMLESRAIFAVVAPEKFSYFRSRMHDVAPGKGFMMLGGGDIAFPLMLVSSVSIDSIENAFVVMVFSFIGLSASFALFFLLGRRPMPALPPIAAFSILGFLFTKIM